MLCLMRSIIMRVGLIQIPIQRACLPFLPCTFKTFRSEPKLHHLQYVPYYVLYYYHHHLLTFMFVRWSRCDGLLWVLHEEAMPVCWPTLLACFASPLAWFSCWEVF